MDVCVLDSFWMFDCCQFCFALTNILFSFCFSPSKIADPAQDLEDFDENSDEDEDEDEDYSEDDDDDELPEDDPDVQHIRWF